MNDKDDTPTWIKQSNAAKKKEAERAEQHAQQHLEAGVLLASKAPDVWQHFVKELGIQAKALAKLDGEELVGAVSPSGLPGGPRNCVVDVNRQSVSRGPYLGRKVFHHDAPGANVIRVTHQNGEEAQLRLGVDPDDTVGFLYQERLLTPEKMAETVIRQMADAANRG